MDINGILNAVFRWLHIIAGILWIGHLWFFNFVNIPFGAKMKEAGVSKTVVPELMPRALFWFRWGAAWTWITGVLLLMLVFYHGGALFEATSTWGPGAIVALVLVFGSPFIYDLIFKSPLAANVRVAYSVCFALVVAVTLLMVYWAGFSYRGYVIHVGAMFGTIMAYNVWVKIWPAQQKIIAAVKAGEAPDAALLALAGSRSRHNTYLAVPLLWAMINQHTAVTAFSSWGYVGFFVIILLGWHLVFQLYKKSLQVQGF
jgi:uncharacterized membrane protein